MYVRTALVTGLLRHTPEIWRTNIDGSGTADFLRTATSIAGHQPCSINYRRASNIWGRSKARLVRSRRSKCLSGSDEGEQQTGQYGEFPHAWQRPPRETQARPTCLALEGSASPPDTLVVAAQQKRTDIFSWILDPHATERVVPRCCRCTGANPGIQSPASSKTHIQSPSHPLVISSQLCFGSSPPWNSLQSCAVLPFPPPVPNFWSGRANSKARTPTRPVDETKPNPEARGTLFAICLVHIIYLSSLACVTLCTVSFSF